MSLSHAARLRVMWFALGSAFGLTTAYIPTLITQHFPLASPSVSELAAGNPDDTEKRKHGFFSHWFADQDSTPENTAVEHADASPDPDPKARTAATTEKDADPSLHTVQSGDTLLSILHTRGVTGQNAYNIVAALKPHFHAHQLRSGQTLRFAYCEPDEKKEGAPPGATAADQEGTPPSFPADYPPGSQQIAEMVIEISPTRKVVLSLKENGRYRSALEEAPLNQQMRYARTSIRSSLFEDGMKAGISANILAQVIKIFSYDVDFQRQIRKGDGLETLYETYHSEDGARVKDGRLRYASLTLGGKKIPLYAFEEDGRGMEYYHADGRHIRKALLKTPINGARISSRYGMRKHPVLGYSKMHKGVDFAAPTGTPIYAAGDGVIEKASRLGSYGNYVRIRHDNTYKTAYAHIHRFAKGMRPGKRVKQGQVIAYVGSTGRSTGPHLHFEVIKNGKHINPKKLKFAAKRKLSGKTFKRFQAAKAKMQSQIASLRGERNIAATLQ